MEQIWKFVEISPNFPFKSEHKLLESSRISPGKRWNRGEVAMFKMFVQEPDTIIHS